MPHIFSFCILIRYECDDACNARRRVLAYRFRWLVLALASTSTAEPEDEALAAYVRFARTTLPRLEKAWAAPHGADAAKQPRSKTPSGVQGATAVHMFDAATIKRIAMLVGRYLDRSDDFAAPDIKPCMT